jgi:8-oxo-dGTP pyrophosphatase MutT (NUDIX family)
MTEFVPAPLESDHATRLEAALQGKKDLFTPAPRASELYVFFSFDLVNSTRYKQVNRDGWPRVTRWFYELIERGIRTGSAGAGVRLWKYVGDEVLLYKRISSPADLFECVPAAYDAMDRAVHAIHAEFPDTKTVLSIKGVVWCAQAHHLRAEDFAGAPAGEIGPYRNIVLPRTLAVGQEETENLDTDNLDFLGPDVDVGFRITRYARRLRLVVSAELAYLLFRDRTNVRDHSREWVEDRLRIVGYEALKGIWGERRYPIIWYEKDWARFEASFWYDERYDSELTQPILDPTSSEPAQIRNVERVFRDLDRLGEVEALHLFLQSTSSTLREPPQDRRSQARPALAKAVGSTAEVHCVAVCVRPADGYVLVAQRPTTKRLLKEYWEFGCGQLRYGETWAECLRRNYKEDFGADLEFGREPQPLRPFIVQDEQEGRRIPGMIFYAEVTNPGEVRAPKHQAYEWINPADPASWNALEKRVPDLEDSIAVAYRVWQERHSTG